MAAQRHPTWALRESEAECPTGDPEWSDRLHTESRELSMEVGEQQEAEYVREIEPDWVHTLLEDIDSVQGEGGADADTGENLQQAELLDERSPPNTASEESKEPTHGDASTWKGIILVVEAVELSDVGLSLEAELDSVEAAQRRESTASIQRFRQRVGPAWRVVTLYKDMWYQSQRQRYADSCLCLDYNDPALGAHLRQAGYIQPVRHVLINPVGMSSKAIAKKYPSPLEIFGWAESKGPRVVWMPDHPDVTQLLRAKNHRSRLCQGSRVSGEELMNVWAQCQPSELTRRQRCRGWETFPLSVGIMWDGKRVEHSKAEWLMKLHLDEWCRERPLPSPLQWQEYASIGGHFKPVEPLPAGTQREEIVGTRVLQSTEWEDMREVDQLEQPDVEMRTDIQLIRRMRLTREAGGLLPQLNNLFDRTLTGFYGLCRRRGNPVKRSHQGKGGLRIVYPMEQGSTLLVAVGRELRKPTQKPLLPQFPLPNGRWFAVSSTLWDVALTTEATIELESGHAHLVPFLHLTSDRSAANCELGYSETGHPVFLATRDLAVEEWLVAYVGPAPQMEVGVTLEAE